MAPKIMPPGKAKAGNGAAPGAASGTPSPFAWGGGFMDTIAKYGRNIERQLYVYGISVSRCASCRNRLKEELKHCENCGQEVPTKTAACTRCKGPTPGIWCYECDAYFCEPCRRMPHGLQFGREAHQKHHCYAIDGSSGTLLHCGSFSETLLKMSKTARRSQMKLRQDLATSSLKTASTLASSSAVTALAAAANELTGTAPPAASPKMPRAEEKQARERKLTAKETAPVVAPPPPPPPSVTTPHAAPAPASIHTPVNAAPLRFPAYAQQQTISDAWRSPSMAPVHASRPDLQGDEPMPSAAPASQQQSSRKRKSPTAETTEASEPTQPTVQHPPHAPSQRPPVVHSTPNMHDVGQVLSGSAHQAAPSNADGHILYAQLMRKHSFSNNPAQRIKNETAAAAATRPPIAPPVSVAAMTSTSGPPPLHHPTASAAASSMDPRRAIHTATSSTPSPSVASTATTTTHHGQVSRELEEALSQPIEPPPAPLVDLSTTESHQMPASNPFASAQPSSRSSSPSGFGATGSLSSAALADPLKVAVVEEYDRVNNYIVEIQKKLALLNDAVRQTSVQDVTTAARISERMVIFRHKLVAAEEQRFRALAKVVLFSVDLRTFARGLTTAQLGDIPHVLTGSHNKCAALANDIVEFQKKQQALRGAIDAAVSSGDVNQLLRLQSLGTEIQTIDEQIRQTRKDRDGQFQLMIQFSRKLRDTVQAEAMALKTRQESASGRLQ